MTLPIVTRTYQTVDYNDLETFIRQETNNKNCELVCSEEWSNDSYYYIGVKNQALSDYEQQVFNAFQAGKEKDYVLRIVMQKLCLDGKIPAGDYLIHVSW